MSCILCEAYLHDYFHQPIPKESPISKYVQHEKLVKRIPELTQLTLRLLNTLEKFTIEDADNDLQRYVTFIAKPENIYDQYDLYTLFLKKNKKFTEEFQYSESALWDYGFLKIPKNDIRGHIHKRWLSFLTGSLLKELESLHSDHSKDHPLWHYDLNKHHPGRPETAPKLKIKIKSKIKVNGTLPDVDNDKDLYF